MSRSGKRWLAAALIAGLGNAVLFASSNFVRDDAFTFFRYTDNFVGGHGLSWNAGGERVEGYTSFLWLMLLVGARRLGIEDLPWLVQLLDVGLYLGLVASAYGLAALVGARRAGPLGACLIASSGLLAYIARGGMEPMLFACLATLAIGGALRWATSGGATLSGLLFGLAALARPEGLLLFAVFCAWALRDGERLRERAFLIRVAAAASVFVPHLAWRRWYYGDWLPNTYYAKIPALSFARFERGLLGLLSVLESPSGALLLAAIALHALAPRRRGRDLVLMLVLVSIAYVTLFIGLERFNWNEYYNVPVIVFSLVLLAAAAAELAHAADWSWTAPRPAIAILGGALIVASALAPRLSWAHAADTAWIARGAALALGALLALAPLGRAGRGLAAAGLALLFLINVQRRQEYADGPWKAPALIDPPDGPVTVDYVQMGRLLHALARPGDTMTTGPCGAIPYYAGLVTYDALGLNDRHIARQPVDDPWRRPFGHEKGDGRYLFALRPTFVLPIWRLTPRPEPACPWDKSFTELFALPEFRRDYEYRAVPMEGGRYLQLYTRRDVGDRPELRQLPASAVRASCPSDQLP
ncbi:MAG TPA: hypothetical protein VFF06_26785 [Polyangia bacterium]|nr:hypothetical protein [Polyangia bacterium]